MPQEYSGSSAFELILSVETSAARIEAALSIDPELSQQWRAQCGLAEAVASVGLEDVRLGTSDLFRRVASNEIGDGDDRAAEDALAALRFMRSPGGSDADVARRAVAAARPRHFRDEPFDMTGISLVGEGGASPVLTALRASMRFAMSTDRSAPVAERLIFMASEHLARGGRCRASSQPEDMLRGLGGRYDASWIVPPALSLLSTGFRIWSPSNPIMARDLLIGAEKWLGRGIGRLAEIRSWQASCLVLATQTRGGSKLSDVISAFAIEPMMSAAQVADRVGMTMRGAHNLLARLSETGLLVEVTRRKAARIWATPGLAQMVMEVGKTGRREILRAEPDLDPNTTVVDPDKSLGGKVLHSGSYNPEQHQAKLDRAMSAFDRALADADEILTRSRERKEARKAGLSL